MVFVICIFLVLLHQLRLRSFWYYYLNNKFWSYSILYVCFRDSDVYCDFECLSELAVDCGTIVDYCVDDVSEVLVHAASFFSVLSFVRFP